jgi:putative membrane protein
MIAHYVHWWFPFFPLLWFGLIFLFWGLFWRRGRWHHHHGGYGDGPSAEQVLGERYARGEITEEEYRQRRTVLRES